MTLIDHDYIERISGKSFDGNSTPTDDEVDTLCIEAQDFVEGLLTFEVEEVTETDELIDVKYSTRELSIKYPITTFTTLEERTNDTYEAKTEGPTKDFTVDKVNGILKATSSFTRFKAGLEIYRLTYAHGIANTDKRYNQTKLCIAKIVQIAVIDAEEGGSGFDTIASFGVGGLNASFKGEEKAAKLWEDAVTLIKTIRGEWRPFSNV